MDAYDISYLISYLATRLFIGLLLGLIPFFMAKKKGRKGLGTVALVSSGISLMAAGVLLFLPVWIMFNIIISLKKPKESQLSA
ncbi:MULTISPECIES: hypothetical protein [Cytobacillus]|uniref:hypothetical protein n=1 Tax=Cytobacillus TaxID=2675230 RepID=UPI00204208AF|nr:hypothetical protein [Cytobacillus firmus]MCM3707382.1 hypothetical protein [Cytobacillus firmus]